MSRYQKGKTNLDFTEARDSEWQWHQLGRMQVCTSLQTDNHACTPPLSFLQAGCPYCRPTNSVKALMGQALKGHNCEKYSVFNYKFQLKLLCDCYFCHTFMHIFTHACSSVCAVICWLLAEHCCSIDLQQLGIAL